MFCKFCGNELPENAKFCPKCGKVAEAKEEETVVVTDISFDDASVEASKQYNEEREQAGGQILKFAILGLVFACTWILSFLGLAFSIICKIKLNNYLAVYGETDGRATVGKGLGKAAMIVSIVMLALLILYGFVLMIIIIAALQ